MEDPWGLYLLWELYFQGNLLTLWANAREKWVNPIMAAEKRRVRETEIVA